MRGARPIDLRGPAGNVFAIAALAQSWNRQLDKYARGSITEATTRRLGGLQGGYDDVLDTFDLWFKGKIDYNFLNDPRDPSTNTEEDDDES